MSPKTEQLKQALEQIRRRWGEDALRPLASASAIPTGFSALDRLLGGGLPRGRISELAGVPTSGATTLAYSILGKAQSQGRLAVYIDIQHVFDPLHAIRWGVQMERMLLVRPPDLLSALEVLRVVAGEEGVGLVVLDDISTASTPTLMNRLENELRRLRPALRQSGCSVALLNLKDSFSSSLQSAALRLRVKRETWLADGEDVQGYQSRVTVLRHPAGAAGQSALISIGLDGKARENAA